jgi:hypothetical protein
VTHLLASEGRIVATSVTGMALGLWLEGYRGWLRGWRPARLGLLAGDLTFWAVALAVTALGLYWANWLNVQLYAVAGMAAGTAFAMLLVGREVRGGVAASSRLVRSALTAAGRGLGRWASRSAGRQEIRS